MPVSMPAQPRQLPPENPGSEIPPAPPGAFTLREFAARYRISLSALYLMLQRGDGPETVKLDASRGGRRIVLYQSALAWERCMLTRSAEAAPGKPPDAE